MTKKLTVLFDANPLASNAKSGIGYYTYQLIQALADEYPDEIQLVGQYFNFLGRRTMSNLPHAQNITYVQTRLWPGKLLNGLRKIGIQLPVELVFKRHGDVALFTNYVSLPSFTHIPTAIAIHDLGYVDVPQYVSAGNREFLQRFVPGSIKRARLIITISETTRRAIARVYGKSLAPIIVTPIPPAKPGPTNVDLGSVGVSGKYILFVGTIEPRKNIINLVKSYERLYSKTRDEYSLVLAGGMGWYMEDTLLYIEKLKAKGLNIVLTGYISEEQRSTLYENCSLFVMASSYEGFGMPLLEAMSYGAVVACSDIAVFHEVAEDAALYFDHTDPDSMATIITRALEDAPLRTKLVKAGTSRVRTYSWKSVARDVFEHLHGMNR